MVIECVTEMTEYSMPCGGVHFLLITTLPNALFNLVLKNCSKGSSSHRNSVMLSQFKHLRCSVRFALFIYIFYFLKSLFGKFGRILSANYN